jgi:hypothetical protein
MTDLGSKDYDLRWAVIKFLVQAEDYSDLEGVDIYAAEALRLIEEIREAVAKEFYK